MNHLPFPSGVRVADAERFIFTHARLLERHRVHLLLHGGGAEAVLSALAAYRNPDGGFGHGLEPDLRSPVSEPLSTLAALDLLAGWGQPDHPWVRSGLEWAAATSGLDGSLPFMTEESGPWPRAPWVQPGPEGSHLTFGFAAAALHTGFTGGWAEAAVDWCRRRLRSGSPLPAYEVKYALRFLSAELVSGSPAGADPEGAPPRGTVAAAGSSESVPGLRSARAVSADVAALRARLDDDGSLPVEGGAEGERLRPWDLAADPWTAHPRTADPSSSTPADAGPGTEVFGRAVSGRESSSGAARDGDGADHERAGSGTPSAARALFTAAQLRADLGRVAGGQHPDGGWTVDWPAWCPAQGQEWRGIRTMESLELLSRAGGH